MKAQSTAPDGPLSFVSRWWQNVKNQYAAVGELGRYDNDEVDQLARDIGISSSDLRTLAGKWPDSPDLLARRMASCGLDTDRVFQTEPHVMRDLERVCGQCGDHSRCRRDLDRDAQGREWRDYCPNVETLDALRSEDRDQRLMRRSRKWRSF